MNHKFFVTFLFTICFSLFGFSAHSQDIGIGEWRTHLPYNQVIGVAIAGDVVFAATPASLFTYNTADNRIQRVDKVAGLNDVGISAIGYNQEQHSLLVAYTNTNLDIIHSNGEIINIPDIKDKDILGNKVINSIMFKGHLAYLSCGFGIVVLDMEREEIYDTYYIGPSGDYIDVYSMTYNDTSFFAATESGIYYADLNGSNLADFNQWHKDLRLKYPQLTYNLVKAFAGKVYCNYYSGEFGGDTMFVFNGEKWDYFDINSTERHHQFLTYKDELHSVNRYNITQYDADGNRVNVVFQINGESFQPLSADKKDNEFLWIGDFTKGLGKNWNTWSGEFIKPNGPFTSNVFALDAEGKNVWVAPGGRQATWAKLYMKDGVFSFIDNTWYVHNQTNTPAFDTITDMVVVKVDPVNPANAYVGTFEGGVMKFENNALTEVYDDKNSTLRPWVANQNLINVSGLDFDSENNLWVANTGAPDILSVKRRNGEWKSFNLGGSLSGIDVGFLMVDSYNQKWINKRTEGFVIVYNDGGTIDDATDDKIKVLSSSAGNGAIPGSKVYSFATDMDGEVWVGSDKGVCVFYSPDRIFENGVNFDAQQILVPRNDGSGLADILLETEVVTAIAVDGANRKWIGTQRAGVFFLSDDGVEQLAHFTTTNSPLLSDNITGITINEDGEVFIGTANGIVSYRSTATPPPTTGSEIYAFPNPVRPDYSGLIAIKGLVSNSNVKITDTYGNLVYETTAEGGQAIWDGYNFDGKLAVSGVYLVFVSDSNGEDTMATKILVIR